MIKINRHRSNDFYNLVIAIFLLTLLAGCNLPQTPAPTEPILVDAFFSGYAYLDVNNNGQIDSEDTPIEDATLIVTLQEGYETGGLTDDSGYAFITIPGGVEYPVTLHMEPPKDSSLKLIGPASVTYPSDERAEFLFSE